VPIDEVTEQLPTVSVVIPTGGGRSRLVDRTISCLLADPATSEVIVVFDRPDVATQSVVDRHAQRDGRVISARPVRSDRDAPHVQIARDQGARLATSEIVLTLDDDVEPEARLVSGHARRHAEGSDLVVLGYMPVVPPERRRGASRAAARLYANNYERACARFRADADAVLLGLWGGNFSVSRRNWLAADALPGSLAQYHEDQDFGLRLRAAGMAGVFDPGLHARHWHRRSVWRLATDAGSEGRGRAALYDAYPELRMFDKGPPPRAAVRPLIWAARSGAAWMVMRLALTGVAAVAAAARWGRIEDASVRALWRVGSARGLYQGGERPI
jgi:hypothetical protein